MRNTLLILRLSIKNHIFPTVLPMKNHIFPAILGSKNHIFPTAKVVKKVECQFFRKKVKSKNLAFFLDYNPNFLPYSWIRHITREIMRHFSQSKNHSPLQFNKKSR